MPTSVTRSVAQLNESTLRELGLLHRRTHPHQQPSVIHFDQLIRDMTFTFTAVLLIVVVVFCLVDRAEAEISYKHCLGPADTGGQAAQGRFFNVCVQEEHFENLTREWDFSKSVIRNTQFTGCTFHFPTSRNQALDDTTWNNVTFKACTFGGKQGTQKQIASFSHATMQNVLFEDCVFSSSFDLSFEKFSLDSVTFRNCIFRNEIRFAKGDVSRMTISHSILGSPTANGTEKNGGNMLMSEMSLHRILIHSTIGSGSIRIQSASVDELEVISSRIGALSCHEQVTNKDGRAKKRITLDRSLIKNVSFTDGFYCDQTEITGLDLLDIRVRNHLDLSKSDIVNLVVKNITSYADDVCSSFSLRDATVEGDTLSDVATTKITFAGAKFMEGITFVNVSISNKDIDLSGTIFSQEIINKECCTLSCLKTGCMCDISHEALVCPKGNASTNVNAKDSCFPARSVVKTVNPLGSCVYKTMEEIHFGDALFYKFGVDTSDVYFFGHKTSSQWGVYRRVTATTNELENERTYVLYISHAHILPVAGRGKIPARMVMVGDKLFTDRGDLATVSVLEDQVMRGMYSPITTSGSLSVDGIIVSAYTEILPERTAAAMLAPFRALYDNSRWGRVILRRMNWLHERSAADYVRMFKATIAGLYKLAGWRSLHMQST